MAKNTVPEAKDALNRFKMEAASEVGVNLKQGYNGDLTSKQAGSVGGQMVKKMIKAYEESMRQFGYQKKRWQDNLSSLLSYGNSVIIRRSAQ